MKQNKKPIKIAIISPLFPNKKNPVSGIFVRQQSKYIAREGHDVTILTTGTKDDKKEEIIDGVPVYRLSNTNLSPVKSLFFSLKCIKMINYLNKKSRVDVIIQNFVGISTIIIGIASKIQKKKFVVISHGTSWELPKDNFFKNAIIRLALSVPDVVVCVSRKTAELLSQNTNQKKLIVINNGIDPETLNPTISNAFLRKKLGLGNKIVLLSVCNLVQKKGIDAIINALAKALKTNSNLEYIIIGDGPEKNNLMELSKKLGMEGHIRFLGVKTGDELSNYYNLCDIFIMMSRDINNEIESFGIAYIEASYFGKPVIAGKSGGTEDAVVNNKTGFIVNSEDEERLIRKIKLLAGSKKLRNKLGNAGRSRVVKGFFWKHNARKLTDTINSI